MPRPDPALRRVSSLLPIVRFGGRSLRQNPADHRKVFGTSLVLGKGLPEDLHGSEVKRADILFDAEIEGVGAIGEADQRLLPGQLTGAMVQGVFGRGGAEFF